MVSRFTDLPRPFNAIAGEFGGDLDERLNALGAFVELGAQTGYSGTAISALQLSPDGRR